MRNSFSTGIWLLLALVTLTAEASFSGPLGMKSRLTAVCTSADTTDQLICAAYVSGFIDGASMERRGSASWGLWCIPTEVGNRQIVERVRMYLKDQRPATTEATMDEVLLASALVASWPCRLN
jgi:hypothetical protein